jgi:hypothetical protein
MSGLILPSRRAERRGLILPPGFDRPPRRQMFVATQHVGFGASAGAVLQPDEITTLRGWWAPDSMNTSGGKLTSWTDKSGNSRTLTPQGTNPDIVSAGGPNGYDAVDLDCQSVSGNERLELASAGEDVVDGHFFAVAKIVTYTGDRFIAYGNITGGGTNENWLYVPSGTTKVGSATHDGSDQRIQWGASNEPAAGSWGLLEAYLEDGVEIGLNIDDGTAVTASIGSVTDSGDRDALTLGNNGAGTQGIDVSFTEVIECTTHLAATPRQQMIDYLVDKYGAIGSW